MAMEDAVALSAELDGAQDIPAALARFAARRQLRTARVQLQSRAIGEHIYHPEGAHAALRNAVMSQRRPEEWYDQVDWLYGSTGLEGAVSAETRTRPMDFVTA